MDSTLKESLEVAQSLKQQNEELKAAFDELKKEYSAVDQELIDLKQEYKNEIEAKKALEVDCKKLYKKWNEELKIQAKEFEKLQSEMIPNAELDLLRVQIIEELELSYNEKMNYMKQQMEKYHGLYTKTFKQYEILKANYENVESAAQHTLSEQTEIWDYKILQLKQENERLKEKVHQLSSTADQATHHDDSKEHELQQKIKTLTQQKQALSEKNSKLNIENEQLKCEHVSNLKELEGKLLLKQAELTGLERRYNDLMRDYEASKNECLRQQHEAEKLERNESNLKNTIESKQHEIVNLNESFAKKEKQMKQQYETEIVRLNECLKQMEEQDSKLKAENERLKQEMHLSSNQHLLQLQQMKQEHGANVNDLVLSRQQMESHYEETKTKLFKLEQESSKKVDALNRELEIRQIKIEQLEKEMENALDLNKSTEREMEELLNDLNCLKKENEEINHEYQALTNKYRECLDANHKWSGKEEKYVAQIEYLEQDITEIQKQIDAKMTSLKQEYEQKVNEVQQRNEVLVNEVSQNKTNNDKIVSKLRKEKQKYKKLATLTKVKIATLSKEINNIKRNFQTEVRAKELEINNLRKQVYELERQRDEIKFRLTMDSTANTVQQTQVQIENDKDHQNQTDLISNNVDILLKELQIENLKHTKSENEVNAEHSS